MEARRPELCNQTGRLISLRGGLGACEESDLPSCDGLRGLKAEALAERAQGRRTLAGGGLCARGW